MSTGYKDAIKTILRRKEALATDRSTWISHWREIRDYVLPEHGAGLDSDGTDAKDDTDGGKRMECIYDATATRAVDVLAAGMHAGLTSPSRPWFKLGVSDPSLADKWEVKRYLHACETVMYAVFAKSNFYKCTHQAYYELAGFGTGPVAMLENFDRVVHCRSFTAGEYLIGTDAEGRVDTLYREMWMTAKQLVEEFGEEQCSRPVVNCYKNGSTEERFKVIHAVEPNDGRLELPAIAEDMRWRSIYMEEAGGKRDDGKLLRVRGYKTFPYLVPRWFVVGNQTYGRSPAMRALPDVKQLQKETEKKLTGLDKLVSPPVASPSGSQSDLTINTFPDGVTVDTSPDGKSLRPLYQVQLPLQYIIADIADLRNQVKAGFYNDLFLMLAQADASSRMTAREVAERHEEKLIMLGPTIERFHDEYLSPAVDRAFSIMQDADLFPEPPPELEGVDLKVEFISILAQAQKMAGIGALEQGIAFVGSLAGLKPEVLDKLDVDEAISLYFDRIGVPPTVVVSDDEVLKVRQRRAEQAQAQQVAAMAAPAADAAQAAKTMSEANLGPNAALAALTGMPSAGAQA